MNWLLAWILLIYEAHLQVKSLIGKKSIYRVVLLRIHRKVYSVCLHPKKLKKLWLLFKNCQPKKSTYVIERIKIKN